MDERSVARSIALGRVAFGLLMLFAPNAVLVLLSDDRPAPLVWLARAFGIRDTVLGVGAVLELTEEEPEGTWVRMGAVADTCDAVAAVRWRDELGTSGAVATLAMAVPAAAGGWWSSTELRRRARI